MGILLLIGLVDYFLDTLRDNTKFGTPSDLHVSKTLSATGLTVYFVS
jgi:hypothetical protein